jgi:uncharacterized protein (DUF433 family)
VSQHRCVLASVNDGEAVKQPKLSPLFVGFGTSYDRNFAATGTLRIHLRFTVTCNRRLFGGWSHGSLSPEQCRGSFTGVSTHPCARESVFRLKLLSVNSPWLSEVRLCQNSSGHTMKVNPESPPEMASPMGKNLRKPALKRSPRRQGKGTEVPTFRTGKGQTSSSKTAAAASSIPTETRAPKKSFTKDALVKTDGVCGGVACIVGTRIPVWILELERRLGMTERQLLQRHPSITSDLLRDALRYADANPEEIERQIASNEG